MEFKLSLPQTTRPAYRDTVTASADRHGSPPAELARIQSIAIRDGATAEIHAPPHDRMQGQRRARPLAAAALPHSRRERSQRPRARPPRGRTPVSHRAGQNRRRAGFMGRGRTHRRTPSITPGRC